MQPLSSVPPKQIPGIHLMSVGSSKKFAHTLVQPERPEDDHAVDRIERCEADPGNEVLRRDRGEVKVEPQQQCQEIGGRHRYDVIDG